MAIKVSDVLENINVNYPVVDATGNHIKGVLFSDSVPAINNTELVEIPVPKRSEKCILIAAGEEKIYIYTGVGVGNEAWAESSNWSAISGDPDENPQGGITLGSDPAYDDDYLLTNNNPAIGDFTLDTTYTEAIDRLNELMGKIVPTAPSPLSLSSLSSVDDTTATGKYKYIFTNNLFAIGLDYQALRATSNGIPHAVGGTISANSVVRWVSDPSKNIYIKYTALGNYAANEGDNFVVQINGSDVTGTSVTVTNPTNGAVYNGSNYTKIALSSSGFPNSGSGAGFYTTYDYIRFDVGGFDQSDFEQGKMNTISIVYNGDSIATADFYVEDVDGQTGISTIMNSNDVPNISPLNFDNGIRFVRASDVDTNPERLSLVITANNISGTNAYGVDDYQTDLNSYLYGVSSDVFDANTSITYPDPVAAQATSGSQTLYFTPKSTAKGLYDLGTVANRPSYGRRSAFGGTSGDVNVTTGDFTSYSAIIYPDIPSSADFWSGNVIVNNSVSSSYVSSAGGTLSGLVRVQDPGAGTAETSFVDTPSGILSTNLYDAKYCNGSSDDGIIIHKSDAIVVAGIARSLNQAALSPWFDGNSLYPIRQGDYSVAEARDTFQYVTMGFNVSGATGNFNLTLKSNGIFGAWLYMKDNGDWDVSNVNNNGWCTLGEPYAGAGVPGGSQDQGFQGAVNNGTFIPTNNTAIDGTYQITSGTVNFTSAQTSTSNGKQVFLRFKIQNGFNISKLSIASI